MTSHREPKPHIEHRHFKPLFNYSEAINCLQTVVQSLVDMTKPVYYDSVNKAAQVIDLLVSYVSHTVTRV